MPEPAYRKFTVYTRAKAFYSEALLIIESLPKGNANIADQLKRAAQSIALNIAEGAGKYMRRDKTRYYLSAEGSAYECGAVLDLLLLERLISEDEQKRLNEDLNAIAGGLVLLAKSLEAR